MNVHILATVLNPDRIKSTLLVFRSIRTGFPTANIFVYGNGIKDRGCANLVKVMASNVGAQYVDVPMHSHGQWIENILYNESSPFWICDTDMVFFDKVEHWFQDSNALFAGRYEPEFWEEWTKTWHVARLHPSLVWFNPQLLRAAIRAWPGKHEFFGSVQTNLIQWSLVPRRGDDLYFYDTLAGLHHALGGQVFTEEQNAAYGHLFCGTYADVLSEHHPNLASKHDAVWDNPEIAKGFWKDQQEWYKQNSVIQESVTLKPQ